MPISLVDAAGDGATDGTNASVARTHTG